MITPTELKALYEKGGNISEALSADTLTGNDRTQAVELSYDLQAGSYIEISKQEKHGQYLQKYTSEIASTISALGTPESILEAGVGEGTTLSGVASKLHHKNLKSYGFDLSWSRIAYAKQWLEEHGVYAELCAGDMMNIPYKENAIDVVYTSHSIEPNRGLEEPMIKELFRITRKYLILLEPGYEFATDEGRERMDRLGYCRGIEDLATSLGYNVIEHKLFPVCSNPLNPTAITIIYKNSQQEKTKDVLVCPKFKNKLIKTADGLYSEKSLAIYPIINKIPCLRIDNAIVASKYPEIKKIC